MAEDQRDTRTGHGDRTEYNPEETQVDVISPATVSSQAPALSQVSTPSPASVSRTTLISRISQRAYGCLGLVGKIVGSIALGTTIGYGTYAGWNWYTHSDQLDPNNIRIKSLDTKKYGELENEDYLSLTQRNQVVTEMLLNPDQTGTNINVIEKELKEEEKAAYESDKTVAQREYDALFDNAKEARKAWGWEKRLDTAIMGGKLVHIDELRDQVKKRILRSKK